MISYPSSQCLACRRQVKDKQNILVSLLISYHCVISHVLVSVADSKVMAVHPYNKEYYEVNVLFLSLSLQRHYSPGWASAFFKSFLHPSRFRATTVQFLHPSFVASSFTPSSQCSLGLPLGRFPPGSLRRTLLDKSSSSWRMTVLSISIYSACRISQRPSHHTVDRVLG